MTTELAITPEQTGFNDKQIAALRSLGVQNAPPADVALFFHQAARTGLDPFARQIYLINRGGKNTIQVGIDGFRVIRDRKGTYQGHTEEWCGPDGQWRDVWLDTKAPPAAARVSVYVKGYVHPVVGIALWSEYAQIGRDGKPQSVWGSKPALMLAKCAEALALRKAYPQDLSGLYTEDELPAAEQDADGVYVTTQMRSTAPKTAKQTRIGAQRPGGGTGAGTTAPAPTEPTRDHSDVYDEWSDRVADISDLDALIRLHDDAAKRNVLDHRSISGESLEERFLEQRRLILEARDQDAVEEPAPAEYADEELPF